MEYSAANTSNLAKIQDLVCFAFYEKLVISSYKVVKITLSWNKLPEMCLLIQLSTLF